VNPTRSPFNEAETVQRRQTEGFNREEIASQ
jgi:hypothetical protein